MDDSFVFLDCRKCSAKNRIPKARIGDKIFCGKCHTLLEVKVYEHPTSANDMNFRSEVLDCISPVLVDFWAPWCGPCTMMSPVLEALAGKYAGKLKVVKINVDENPTTASRYGIRSIPSLLLFKNGDVVDTLMGARPQLDLERHIERVIT
jgi:thioredoxin 2